MDARTRTIVRDRAKGRCEYCQIHQWQASVAAFHIEHIIPRKHGGTDDLENLAFSCFHCNGHKGPNLTGIDPISAEIVQLFHPRQNIWAVHFAVIGAEIVGTTPIGRATVEVLAMNESAWLDLRRRLIDASPKSGWPAS